MDIKIILEIAENVSKRSNKDLIEAATILSKEFEDTKTLMIQLSHHLDNVENSYYQISEEVKKRKGITDV
jgi:hypothetical protein